MNNRRKKTISISIDAIFLAIIFLMTYTQIGFIPLGVISVTIVHVPVLVGAYLFGHKKGALYGLFFGLVSFLKAIESPMSILDPYFQNPLISVFPRIMFGLIAGLIFEFIKKTAKKHIFTQPLIFIGSFIATLIHSVMVLSLLGLVYGKNLDADLTGYYSSFLTFMAITLGTSSLLEALCGGILTPFVSFPLKKYVLKNYLKVIEISDNKKINDTERIKSKLIMSSDNEFEIELRIKK